MLSSVLSISLASLTIFSKYDYDFHNEIKLGKNTLCHLEHSS